MLEKNDWNRRVKSLPIDPPQSLLRAETTATKPVFTTRVYTRQIDQIHLVMSDPTEIPTDEVMRSCAANHTRRAARTITRAYDRALEPCGLKVTQFTILTALTQTSFDAITSMADRLALERSSLSRNLNRLEREGLVCMTDEGRSRTIEITEAGIAKVEEAYPLWRGVQDKVEEAVGEETWAHARSLLRSLVNVGAAV